jgi:hypothetical protein
VRVQTQVKHRQRHVVYQAGTAQSSLCEPKTALAGSTRARAALREHGRKHAGRLCRRGCRARRGQARRAARARLLGLREIQRDHVEALGVQQLQLGRQRLLAQAGHAAVGARHDHQAPRADHVPRLLPARVGVRLGLGSP